MKGLKMRNKGVGVALVVMYLVLAPVLAWGQTTGQISGKVLDATNNQALVSATVMLKGTSLGASTDPDGNFLIKSVPAGSYTLRVSYIGFKTYETNIEVGQGAILTQDFKLEPEAIQGQEVVITAQAMGQKAAIQQQLASDKIVNIVSAARIQQLPDVNAAESVGRLPGVSVTRSGGEATGVVIRGLEPKYGQILIDGVEMAGTSSTDRSTDLSMISSNMLSGIEVYKTLTPDMDAAVLGGVVNFTVREAEKSATGAPRFGFLAQGGYNDLVSRYNNYKFAVSVEDRYFDDDLGVFAQGIVEKVNRTDDEMGGGFNITNGTHLTGAHDTYLGNLNLTFAPRVRQRYDAALDLDYRLKDGRIALKNFFSRGNTTQNEYSQRYYLDGNSIYFTDTYSFNTKNIVTNLLDYQQVLGPIAVNAKAAHSFTENSTPDQWDLNFWQETAGITGIDNTLSPQEIARQVAPHIDLNEMFMYQPSLSTSYSKQQDFTGSLDLKSLVNFSDEITVEFKAGGQWRYTRRAYSESNVAGTLWNPPQAGLRAAIIKAFPWMQQPPYNLNPNGGQQIPIGPFLDSNFNYGKFFSGQYTMGPGTNADLIRNAIQAALDTSQSGNWNLQFKPSNLDLISSNYYGHENRTGLYVMATVNIGADIIVIPGIRYQALATSYSAPRIYNPNFNYDYPVAYPHQDTTINQYHGYWLPDVSVRYKPMSWFDVRLAYTNTLSYPDFDQITPLINVQPNAITWHNFALSPARSHNYDAAVSVYDNSVGLFTVGGFLKRIDGLIFDTGKRYPQNFSAFPGIPSPLPGVGQYSISYSINNPYRTDVWGAEAEWQTHFWYLPQPLDGLVLNVNYTHIFSGAKYPFTYNYQTGYPPKVVYVDTFYTDRLYRQPDNIANLSIGYDYKAFSFLVSMQYQSNIFNSNNFWPELRVYKANYRRWDISAKQGLPWFGLEIYLDVNNLNRESDVYIIQGPGFPSSAQDYGMTADVGIRWKL
jgi:TonB-dependent receptor